ncbi:MAG: hypothetical protein U0Y10_18375 [Spirosomataceae bacterium]
MTALFSIFLALTLTSAVYSNAQVNDEVARQKVLQKAVVDSLFIFGKWTEKGGTETHLKYLGQVRTKHGQTFKILNSSWFWGLSHRVTSRILVFNDKNKYVGNYPLTLTTDLPTKMENGKLIFKNTDADCDKNLITIINLKNGLPRQFFRKCKGKNGDIYIFDTE